MFCFISCSILFVFFFFFKQKTAYEMRISDWSSDVCSSDLLRRLERLLGQRAQARQQQDGHERRVDPDVDQHHGEERRRRRRGPAEIGEAHQPDEVAQDAEIGVGHQLPHQRRDRRSDRSEEHTSELQSLMRISYAVFCLKKKKKKSTDANYRLTLKYKTREKKTSNDIDINNSD